MSPNYIAIINERLDAHVIGDSIIRGYGKPGHGMNGKDADLDRVGQCVVNKAECRLKDDDGTPVVDLHLRLYASICAPCYGNLDHYRSIMPYEVERQLKAAIDIDLDDDDALIKLLREQAEVIVRGMDPETGDFMWDGDGSWDGGVDVVLECALNPATLYALAGARRGDFVKSLWEEVAEGLYDCLTERDDNGNHPHPDIARFEHEVGLANDRINQLLWMNGQRPQFVVEHKHLTDDGKGTTRTLIGPFNDRDSAEAEAKRLAALPYSEATPVDLNHPTKHDDECAGA